MNIDRFKINLDAMARTNRYEVEIHGPAGIRSRGLRCTDVSIPAKSIGTTSNSYLSAGPESVYADSVDYGQTVSLTFMLDHTYEDRQKMELWQSFIYDEAYNLQYPDKYWGSMKIIQMGVDNLPIYEVELHQCFPTTISSIGFASGGETSIQTFSTDFSFRSWSSSFENSPGGLLGGLFNKFSRKLESKVNKKLSDKLFG